MLGPGQTEARTVVVKQQDLQGRPCEFFLRHHLPCWTTLFFSPLHTPEQSTSQRREAEPAAELVGPSVTGKYGASCSTLVRNFKMVIAEHQPRLGPL